jgi:hypothetical protein
VGELVRREGGEEGAEAADEPVAGLGVGAGAGDLQGDEPEDVGEQGVDGPDHGLVGEAGRAQHRVDGRAQAQAVGAGAATFVGAASVLLSLIGFLRWVFVVPPLAGSYMAGDATTRAAAWMAQHQFGGALLGEHLGQLLAIGWSVTVSALALGVAVLRRPAPHAVGWARLRDVEDTGGEAAVSSSQPPSPC